jgi:hypothetical protein
LGSLVFPNRPVFLTLARPPSPGPQQEVVTDRIEVTNLQYASILPLVYTI